MLGWQSHPGGLGGTALDQKESLSRLEIEWDFSGQGGTCFETFSLPDFSSGTAISILCLPITEVLKQVIFTVSQVFHPEEFCLRINEKLSLTYTWCFRVDTETDNSLGAVWRGWQGLHTWEPKASCYGLNARASQIHVAALTSGMAVSWSEEVIRMKWGPQWGAPLARTNVLRRWAIRDLSTTHKERWGEDTARMNHLQAKKGAVTNQPCWSSSRDVQVPEPGEPSLWCLATAAWADNCAHKNWEAWAERRKRERLDSSHEVVQGSELNATIWSTFNQHFKNLNQLNLLNSQSRVFIDIFS